VLLTRIVFILDFSIQGNNLSLITYSSESQILLVTLKKAEKKWKRFYDLVNFGFKDWRFPPFEMKNWCLLVSFCHCVCVYKYYLQLLFWILNSFIYAIGILRTYNKITCVLSSSLEYIINLTIQLYETSVNKYLGSKFLCYF
jgi:hypothetical protein